MNQDLRALALYRLERARETLHDAKTYLESTSLSSAVNRIYYALFYAVSSLLICHGFSSSRHSGIRAIFNKEFIRIGIVEERHGVFFTEMFNTRQKGDYGDFVSFERTDVVEWLALAEQFIAAIEILVVKETEKA